MASKVEIKLVAPGIVKVEGAKFVKNSQGRTWAVLDGNTFAQVLDAVFKISRRFESGNDFAKWLRTMINSPFIFADVDYYIPLDITLDGVYAWWDLQMMQILTSLELGGPRPLETMDCDDWSSNFSSRAAFDLATNAFPRLWGILEIDGEKCGHAYNAVVIPVSHDQSTGTVVLAVLGFEPQLNTATTPDENGEFTIQVQGLGTLRYNTYAALSL